MPPRRPDVSLLEGLLDGLSGCLDDNAGVYAGSIGLWEAPVLRKALLGGTRVSAVGTGGGGITGRHLWWRLCRMALRGCSVPAPLALAPRARGSPHGRRQLLGGRR